MVVLKLLVGAARPARAAIGCGRAATMFVRRKLEGPRAAARSSEADMVGQVCQLTFSWGWKTKSRAGRRREAGNWRERGGELVEKDGLAREGELWCRLELGAVTVCAGVEAMECHGYWNRMISRLCEPCFFPSA